MAAACRRAHDSQLRAVRLRPEARPLLPDADPGSDRLCRSAHRSLEHPGGCTGLAQPGRRGGKDCNQRRAWPQGDDQDAPGLPDHDHGSERERRSPARQGMPALRLLRSAATTSSSPLPNATGNAPSFDYFHSTVYWNPQIKQSQAAARSVAKLFAPADVKRVTPDGRAARERRDARRRRRYQRSRARSRPLRPRGCRRPASPRTWSRIPYDTSGPLPPLRRRSAFKLDVPTVIESSSAPDRVRAAVRLSDPQGERRRFGSSSARPAAPTGVSSRPTGRTPRCSATAASATCSAGRTYDFYYGGAKLHMIVLRADRGDVLGRQLAPRHLSNETMIAIAKGLKPLAPAKSSLRGHGTDRILRRRLRRSRQRGVPRRARAYGRRPRRRSGADRRASGGQGAVLRAGSRGADREERRPAHLHRSRSRRRARQRVSLRLRRHSADPLRRREPLRGLVGDRGAAAGPRAGRARDEEHGAGRHRREGPRRPRCSEPHPDRLRVVPRVPRRGKRGP